MLFRSCNMKTNSKEGYSTSKPTILKIRYIDFSSGQTKVVFLTSREQIEFYQQLQKHNGVQIVEAKAIIVDGSTSYKEIQKLHKTLRVIQNE